MSAMIHHRIAKYKPSLPRGQRPRSADHESHAKPPRTPGVRALPVSRKAAKNARSSCPACLTQSRQERKEFVPCLSHAKPPRTPGVRALPVSRKAARNARRSCPACLTQSRQERQEFVLCLSHAKPPRTPGVRALPVSRKAAKNARSSCFAWASLAHAGHRGLSASTGECVPSTGSGQALRQSFDCAQDAAQDRPFDRLRTGPSTGSGQALREPNS
jgi:hypothetical protein